MGAQRGRTCRYLELVLLYQNQLSARRGLRVPQGKGRVGSEELQSKERISELSLMVQRDQFDPDAQ